MMTLADKVETDSKEDDSPLSSNAEQPKADDQMLQL
jgi:hypothetical protein